MLLIVSVGRESPFFCQVVERPIGNAPIDYAQLYAQALAEIEAGEPTFFSKEEEAEIEAHNAAFYRHSPLAEAFAKSFAAEGEQLEWLSPNEIFEILKRESPKALQGISITKLGKELRALGEYVDVEVRTATGRVDMVMQAFGKLYLFELKLNRSAAAAMQQINLNDYPARFSQCGLPIVKVGINFDTATRTLSDWVIE